PTTRITLRNLSPMSPHVPNCSIDHCANVFTSRAPRCTSSVTVTMMSSDETSVYQAYASGYSTGRRCRDRGWAAGWSRRRYCHSSRPDLRARSRDCRRRSRATLDRPRFKGRKEARMPSLQNIDAPALKALIDQGRATVIDVREPDEYAREHIAGARSLPLSQ